MYNLKFLFCILSSHLYSNFSKRFLEEMYEKHAAACRMHAATHARHVLILRELKLR
jgi:uncharacterized protein YeaO (DUF488 family)